MQCDDTVLVNVSSKRSVRTNSSTSSLRLQAEAKRAALIAHAAALKEKQKLDQLKS